MCDQLQLVGVQEIAQLLGVRQQTVQMWRHRKILPTPEWTISSIPIWTEQTIVEWAAATRRLERKGSDMTQAATARQLAENEASHADHGPGCDGPLNCTCASSPVTDVDLHE